LESTLKTLLIILNGYVKLDFWYTICYILIKKILDIVQIIFNHCGVNPPFSFSFEDEKAKSVPLVSPIGAIRGIKFFYTGEEG